MWYRTAESDQHGTFHLLLPSCGLLPFQAQLIYLAFGVHPLPPNLLHQWCFISLRPVLLSVCSSLFIYKKTGGSCWYLQSVSHFLPSRTISPQKQLVLCCFYFLIIQSMNLPVISFLFPTFYWKHSSRMPTMISLMFTPALSSDLKLLIEIWPCCHIHLYGPFLLCFETLVSRSSFSATPDHLYFTLMFLCLPFSVSIHQDSIFSPLQSIYPLL